MYYEGNERVGVPRSLRNKPFLTQVFVEVFIYSIVHTYSITHLGD